MEIQTVVKQAFAVIGKEGQGSASAGWQWVPPLWQSANEHFGDITSLAKRNEDGSLAGLWGAMSDVDDSFNPWGENGKYLAGCEVTDDATAPTGWTKWVVPGYKFLAAPCTQQTYGEVFGKMIGEYLPQHGYQLAGAVHEYYDPKEQDGNLYLYFPIERL